MSAATLTAAEAGCPFCKLVMERVTTGRGIEQIGSSGVYHFEPLNPVTPGHRLFVPAFHYEDAAEAPSATGAVFEWAAWWAAQQDEDFNLIVNAGPAASQTVRHLHIHYVPRRPSDGLILPWSSLTEPMRDADGDMISSGEHRKISMSGDSFFVCDTCTNVLGLNVRWDHASKREDHQAAVESLPVEPAEDEREALVNVIRLFFQNWRAIGKVPPALEVSIDSLEGAVDDLIELGEPRPITDEMVKAAAREYHERGNGEGSFARMSGHVRTSLLFRMKCALGAAEEARR